MLYFPRWKSALIWLVVIGGILMAMPNLLTRQQLDALPDFLPKRQMTLGLDLQGGVHLLLQIDRNEIAAERLTATEGDVRQLLREAGIGYTGLSTADGAVEVRIRDEDQVAAAREALAPLTQPINATLFGTGTVSEIAIDEPQPGLLRLALTPEGIDYRLSSAVSQSVEVVRRRIDELGTTEPLIQQSGEDRVLVQVPGEADPQRVKDLIGQTARLSFRMVDTSMPVQEALNGRPPPGTEILYSADEPPIPYLVETRELVSGENLTDSQAGFDQQTNEPIVSFRFDTRGAQRFGQATQQNVGVPFAIILDDQVISAPVIREPILGGSGQIAGNFTPETANDLAILLRAGALPADLTIVEERTVGPSLGQDSINAGTAAGIIAGLLVAAFMLSVYGLFGAIALAALIANVALLVAILSVLGATLTLPGIAGIVLTIGMAVDSNVVIIERIRDEARDGRSPLMAIDRGFSFALGTIMDANVTSFVTALLLFLFGGSGPVRGFAVTFMIGIITTVFTAYTLTRLLMALWVRTRRPKTLPI